MQTVDGKSLRARLVAWGSAGEDVDVGDVVGALASASASAQASALDAVAEYEAAIEPSPPTGLLVLLDRLLQQVAAEEQDGATALHALAVRLFKSARALTLVPVAHDLHSAMELNAAMPRGVRKNLLALLGIALQRNATGAGADEREFAALLSLFLRLASPSSAASLDAGLKVFVLQTATSAAVTSLRPSATNALSVSGGSLVRACKTLLAELANALPALHRMAKTVRTAHLDALAQLLDAGVREAIESQPISAQLLEMLVSHALALDDESRSRSISLLATMRLSAPELHRLLAMSGRSAECAQVLVAAVERSRGAGQLVRVLSTAAPGEEASARLRDQDILDQGMLDILAACPRSMLLHRIDTLCSSELARVRSRPAARQNPVHAPARALEGEYDHLRELELLLRCKPLASATPRRLLDAVAQIAELCLGSADRAARHLGVELAMHSVRHTTSRELACALARALHTQLVRESAHVSAQVAAVSRSLFWAILASAEGESEQQSAAEALVRVDGPTPIASAADACVSTAEALFVLIADQASLCAASQSPAALSGLREWLLRGVSAVAAAALDALSEVNALGLRQTDVGGGGGGVQHATLAGPDEDDYMSAEVAKQERETVLLEAHKAHLARVCAGVSGSLGAAIADGQAPAGCRVAAVQSAGLVLRGWARATEERFCDPALEKALAAAAACGRASGESLGTAVWLAALEEVYALLAAGHELCALGRQMTEAILWDAALEGANRMCRVRAIELVAKLAESQRVLPQVGLLVRALAADVDEGVAAVAGALLARTVAAHGGSEAKSLCKAVLAACRSAELHELPLLLRRLAPLLNTLDDQPAALAQLALDATKMLLAGQPAESSTPRRVQQAAALLAILPCCARSVALLRSALSEAAALLRGCEGSAQSVEAHLATCIAPNSSRVSLSSRRLAAESRALLANARELADELRALTLRAGRDDDEDDDAERCADEGRAVAHRDADDATGGKGTVADDPLARYDAQVAAVEALALALG